MGDFIRAYQTELPDGERAQVEQYLKQVGFEDSNDRRELNLGFAGLRKKELITLFEDIWDRGDEVGEDPKAALLAQRAEQLWISGQIEGRRQFQKEERPPIHVLIGKLKAMGMKGPFTGGYETLRELVAEAEREKDGSDRGAPRRRGRPPKHRDEASGPREVVLESEPE